MVYFKGIPANIERNPICYTGMKLQQLKPSGRSYSIKTQCKQASCGEAIARRMGPAGIDNFPVSIPFGGRQVYDDDAPYPTRPLPVHVMAK